MAQSKPKSTIQKAHAQGKAVQGDRLRPEVWFARGSGYAQAGWNHAMEGLALKVAKQLGYKPRLVCFSKPIDPAPPGTSIVPVYRAEGEFANDQLKHYMQEHGAPAVWLGGHGVDCGYKGPEPFRCDARPDMGNELRYTPAISHLTAADLRKAGIQASALPEWKGRLLDKKVLIGIAGVPGANLQESLLAEVDYLLESNDNLTIMLTSSPRTSHEDYVKAQEAVRVRIDEAKSKGKKVELITQAFRDCMDSVYLARMGKGEAMPNRYTEMLAIADAVMIMGESRSMLGDALLSNAAIYICNPAEPNTPLCHELYQRGTEHFFGQKLEQGRIVASSFEGQVISTVHTFTPLDAASKYVMDVLADYREFCRDHPERAPLQSKVRA